MSIMNCESCNAPIDTDKDVECEIYVGNYKRLHGSIILCPGCREERENEYDRKDHEMSRAEAEAEKRS
jgi:hypothetical protein